MSFGVNTMLMLGILGISLLAWQRPALMNRLIFNPWQIQQSGQFDRFLGSAFIHKDGWHLFFNLFALYFFGEKVELFYTWFFPGYGPFLFVLLFVVGAIVASIPSYIKHRHFMYYNSLGASGGVSAVVFSSIMFDPMSKICLYFAICLPGVVLGTLFLAYSWYRGKYQTDSINHDAHLYGALFGLFFTIILKPSVLPLFLNKLADFTLF